LGLGLEEQHVLLAEVAQDGSSRLGLEVYMRAHTHTCACAGLEEKHALLAKAALGTVMENASFGRRLLAFCRRAMRVLCQQPAAVQQQTPDVLVIVLADALRYCAALFPSLIFQGCQATMDDIYSFLFKFASDAALVTNPYTRAYLVKTIYGFTPHKPANLSEPLPSPLIGTTHGRDQLMPFLFQFFVDMEQTGEGDAYYNKFNYRFFALTIIDYLWGTPSGGMHKRAARQVAPDTRMHTHTDARTRAPHWCELTRAGR
jgi:hypothetical protein